MLLYYLPWLCKGDGAGLDVVAEAIGGRFDVVVDMQEEFLSSAQIDLEVIESLKEKR